MKDRVFFDSYAVYLPKKKKEKNTTLSQRALDGPADSLDLHSDSIGSST